MFRGLPAVGQPAARPRSGWQPRYQDLALRTKSALLAAARRRQRSSGVIAGERRRPPGPRHRPTTPDVRSCHATVSPGARLSNSRGGRLRRARSTCSPAHGTVGWRSTPVTHGPAGRVRRRRLDHRSRRRSRQESRAPESRCPASSPPTVFETHAIVYVPLEDGHRREVVIGQGDLPVDHALEGQLLHRRRHRRRAKKAASIRYSSSGTIIGVMPGTSSRAEAGTTGAGRRRRELDVDRGTPGWLSSRSRPTTPIATVATATLPERAEEPAPRSSRASPRPGRALLRDRRRPRRSREREHHPERATRAPPIAIDHRDQRQEWLRERLAQSCSEA